MASTTSGFPGSPPSAALDWWALVEPRSAVRWRRFARSYRKEMAEPAARDLIAARDFMRPARSGASSYP